MVDIRAVTDPIDGAGVNKVDVLAEDDGTLVVNQRNMGAVWLHHDPLTVSTTPIPLPEVFRHGHSRVTIEVQTAAIRYSLDGDNPTASTGRQGLVNDLITLENEYEVTQFRAIRRDAADSTLDVTYGTAVIS